MARRNDIDEEELRAMVYMTALRCAEALHIDEREMPEIHVVRKLPEGVTDTTLGCLVPEDNALYVKRNPKDPFMMAFVTAHEIRHVWQQKNEGWENIQPTMEKRSMGHAIRVKGQSAIEYSSQTDEIDAHAFGYVFMKRVFGLKPLFNGLPADLVKSIVARANAIEPYLEF